MWIGVTPRFRAFHQNLFLTPDQASEGSDHHAGVQRSLANHYFGGSPALATGFLIGSWGKQTMTRPPRDIDLLFPLPYAVYQRFQGYQANRQSALLQEVRRVLQETYPRTDLRGDGQVVVVGFNRMNVEVVPAFELQNGQYWICDTSDGGRYKAADPKAEIQHVAATDHAHNGNLRALIMMMKAWQECGSVPIKSFQIELVAADFIQQCPWGKYSYFWYDWIMRDFFAFLYSRANGYVVVPGTQEAVALGDDWQSRVESAYHRAVKACEYERLDLINMAGDEWQKIFGIQIPQTV